MSRALLMLLVPLGGACGDSDVGAKPSASPPSGLGSAELRGRWSYTGDGWGPEGQTGQRKLSVTYTFLSDGTYVREMTSQESGATNGHAASGRWDVYPDSIILVQQHRQFNGGTAADTSLATSKIDAKLSADGKELTLHGEDGDCPGSDCTRAFKKQ